MHERPAGKRHIPKIAITIEEARRLYRLPQGIETSAASIVQGRVRGFFLDRWAEHKLEEARLLACENDIGDA